MPRSTLKLPAKTAAEVAAGGTSGRSRRPVRGQGAVARHAGRLPSAADSPPAAASQPARPEPVAAAPRSSPMAKPERPDAGRDVAIAGRAKDARPLPPGTGRGASAPLPDERGARRASGSAPGVDAAAGGRPAGAQPDAPRKQHPPRGVARSTGARACPPSPPAAVAATAGGDTAEPRSTLAGHRVAPPASKAAAAPGLAGMAKEPPRLSRLVSEMAGCSRREADEWIDNGWVSVDGVVISRLGARVSPKAKIEIREAASKHRSTSVSIMFHQPAPAGGEALEPMGRQRAALSIRADNRWVEDDAAQRFVLAHLRGLAPAGALDASAGGMLVFTQEGSVARRLAGGDARLEKEYHALVEGALAAGGIEQLRHGLVLDGIRLRPADVSWLAENRLRIVLRQSLPRQIPRMCALLGLRVRELRCVRIGSVSLGRLPPGAWRYLRADERF